MSQDPYNFTYVQSPLLKTLTWHSQRGFEEIRPGRDVGLNVCVRGGDGRWCMRSVRRKGGRTWKRLFDWHPFMKRIRMEALLQGIEL